MTRRPMSAAARKRLSQAAKRRWREFRRAKAAGKPVHSMGPRRGRPAASANAFLGMTVEALVTAKRQIDQAMRRLRGLLAGD